jgi:hypothetical protein
VVPRGSEAVRDLDGIGVRADIERDLSSSTGMLPDSTCRLLVYDFDDATW